MFTQRPIAIVEHGTTGLFIKIILMRLATASDKNTVVNILTKSFNDNKSVNYLIPQDQRRGKRYGIWWNIPQLLPSLWEVFLSDDGKACALIIYPDRKKTTAKSLLLDIKLVFTCIGPSN